MNRRRFFAGGWGVWLARGWCRTSYPAALAAAGRPGANGVLRIGLIGCGIRGKYLIGNLPPEGRVTAICDCYAPRMAGTLKPEAGSQNARVLSQFLEHDADRCATYRDYRRMLDEAALDAVIIATPDHHHVQAAMLACQAGLDVYCEKPLTLTIAEGQRLIASRPQSSPRAASGQPTAFDGDGPLCLPVRPRRQARPRLACRTADLGQPVAVSGPAGGTAAGRDGVGIILRADGTASLQLAAMAKRRTELGGQAVARLGHVARLLRPSRDQLGRACRGYGPMGAGHGRLWTRRSRAVGRTHHGRPTELSDGRPVCHGHRVADDRCKGSVGGRPVPRRAGPDRD